MIEPDVHKRYVVMGRDLALLEDTVREALKTNRTSDLVTVAYQLENMILYAEEVRK